MSDQPSKSVAAERKPHDSRSTTSSKNRSGGCGHVWRPCSATSWASVSRASSLRARFEQGQDAAALDQIRRTWGYMVANGPGTMWETIGPFGGAPTDAHPSWDAGWSSGAAPALTEYVLGVAPTSPGFKTFSVKPHAGDLSAAAGDVPTPFGSIRVSWTKRGKALALAVTSPPGIVWSNRPKTKSR